MLTAEAEVDSLHAFWHAIFNDGTQVHDPVLRTGRLVCWRFKSEKKVRKFGCRSSPKLFFFEPPRVLLEKTYVPLAIPCRVEAVEPRCRAQH